MHRSHGVKHLLKHALLVCVCSGAHNLRLVPERQLLRHCDSPAWRTKEVLSLTKLLKPNLRRFAEDDLVLQRSPIVVEIGLVSTSVTSLHRYPPKHAMQADEIATQRSKNNTWRRLLLQALHCILSMKYDVFSTFHPSAETQDQQAQHDRPVFGRKSWQSPPRTNPSSRAHTRT